jgi:uncharacterized protein (TIGR03083 family)
MDLDTTRTVEDLRPITRDHDAREVALAAYERLLGVLEGLTAEDWHRDTECTGWDVAAMVGHVLGASAGCASVREMVRQQLWGARHARDFGGNALDATNDLQVRDHADLSSEERLAALRDLAPAAVRGRLRLPGLLRRVRVPLDQGGSTAPGMPSHLVLGHLMDVIYTRDTWLHAIDVSRATGTPFVPDHAVDRRIVEDVVVEWAGRHGRPVTLHLTGPAGGRFVTRDPGPELTLDAIGFCRILSGRAEPADALPDDVEPTPAVELLGTRVLF